MWPPWSWLPINLVSLGESRPVGRQALLAGQLEGTLLLPPAALHLLRLPAPAGGGGGAGAEALQAAEQGVGLLCRVVQCSAE